MSTASPRSPEQTGRGVADVRREFEESLPPRWNGWKAEEVVEALMSLAFRRSYYITGTSVSIDGELLPTNRSGPAGWLRPVQHVWTAQWISGPAAM